ncbi:hypothetical protein [Clostridium cavendishii]|nr:hypothetical protein [Clostridium cavendishii]
MTNMSELEEELVELKLKKRNLILAGKKTEEIDLTIKEIENKIKLQKQQY